MLLNNSIEPVWAFGEWLSLGSDAGHKQGKRGRVEARGVPGGGQG